MHHLIIGNGVAGINAAHQIRNRHKDAKITIISYESDNFFSRTALMYVASGQLSYRCVEPYARDHYEKMHFERVRDQVVSIDSSSNTVNLQSGNKIKYDRLLIASGSLPVMAPWPGNDLDGVGTFVTWDNMTWLSKMADKAKKAVVVGGGLIGIEVVEVLLQRGIDVTFLVREDFFWPIALNKDEGTLIAEELAHHGCDLRLQTEMTEILGSNGKVTGIKLKNGEQLDTDMVVIAIGVRPQTDFLKESEVELDERGGIIVNQQLQTNIENIYAAGDCSSVVWFNDVRRPEQLWYTSRDQGKIAGLNMAGDERIYKRATFYNSAKFLDIEYTTAGLVNFNLEGERDWYQQEPGTKQTERISYLPDGTVVGFNMLGRRWDHRILVSWVEQKRDVKWVLEHLHEAIYDEEFMKKFAVLDKSVKTEVV